MKRILIFSGVLLAGQVFFSCSSARQVSQQQYNTLAVAQQAPFRQETIAIPDLAEITPRDTRTNNTAQVRMTAPYLLKDKNTARKPAYRPGNMSAPEIKPAVKKKPVHILGLADEEPEKKTNTMALLSLIFAITGILLFPLFLIASIIVGFIGLSQIKKNPEKYKGKGLAIAGIIISFAVLFLLIALVALYVFVLFLFV